MEKLTILLQILFLCSVVNSRSYKFGEVFQKAYGNGVNLKLSIEYEENGMNREVPDDIENENVDLSNLELSPETLFEGFIKQFNKEYSDDVEKSQRFKVFQENLKKIRELNADPNDSAEYGINHLTDKALEEITGVKVPEDFNSDIPVLEPSGNLTALPRSFDWRRYNAVGPVKNQQHCGTCWAFSTTGVLEGAYAIKHKRLLSFSEQELVDCDDTDGHCENGGWPERALFKIKALGGIMLEQEYPYVAHNQNCRYNRNRFHANVNTVYRVRTDEPAIQQIVATWGPVSIALNAELFHHYRGGIIRNSNCPHQLNHAVLAVGYGEENGTPFWIIKNSWSQGWGEGGYVRMYRGANLCGLATAPVIATVY